MKKLLFLAAFGVAGLVNARNSKIAVYPQVEIKKKSKPENFKVIIPGIRYGYSYQSTCGWTFSMFSDVAVQDMTESEFNDYQLDVKDMNDYICKLHGQKPVYDFTLNEGSMHKIIKEKV